MKKITKIVLTGGPGCGKTVTIETLKKNGALDAPGRAILFCPETASELICGGIDYTTCKAPKIFQSLLLNLSIKKEDVYEKATECISADEFIIFYDRGLLDGNAYISDEDFADILSENSITREEILKRYDAVIFLGTPDDYTTANNAARTEDKKTAIELAQRTKKCWDGVDKFYYIPAFPTFEEKIEKILETIQLIIT